MVELAGFSVDLVQVVALAFALFAWSRVVLRFKDRRISVGDFLFWSVIWIGAAAAAIFPRTIKTVSLLFGVGRPIDIIVYASIVVLFYLVFRLYVKLEQQREGVTKLVRGIALQRKKYREFGK